MGRIAVAAVVVLFWIAVVLAQNAGNANLKPSTWQAKYTSARIEALKQQIRSGNRSTDAFWQEVAKEGTPLVEPDQAGDRHQIVTFLWRGSDETRNVLIIMNPFTLVAPQDYMMVQVADSDVWYLTMRVPRGARFTYKLSPNDPLGPTSVPRAQADPLNPHRWLCDANAGAAQCFSMVELPGAVPQPWITYDATARAGTLVQHRFRSDLLKNERDVWIYVPPGYRPDGAPCALLLLFDGRAYSSIVPTPIILDNLLAASKIPPTIAVLIGDSDRGRELVPAPEFADSLAKEVVPWIRTQYRIAADPRQTVIGGSSAGGFVAAYTALRYPEVFGNVLSQSGAYFRSPDLRRYLAERALASTPGDHDRHDLEELQDRGVAETTSWLARQVIDRPKLPLSFYMDAGLFEIDFTGSGLGILESTRYMRDVLLAKGYEVHYQMFIGGHDYLSWRGTLADGLLALIGTKSNP